MSGLAQASCQLTRVRDANSRSAKGWPRNRTKYAYDANGNATSRQGNTIAWSSYNYPTTVSAGSGSTAETVSFNYGPSRERWQQSYSGNSTTEITDYAGGLFEVVTNGSATNYRHYIKAGGENIAVYSRQSNGTNTFNYVLSDHQASVASITNSSGAQVVGESFDAFGNRRNPTTWSGADTNTDLTTIAGITRQGYTFQTALGLWMGLNHMNGRVEDSVTGRMLSADPSIPNIADPQSYNRYSYANNNPVTFTDPTGFSSCPLQTCKPVDGSAAMFGPRHHFWGGTVGDPGALPLNWSGSPGSVQGISGFDANDSDLSTTGDPVSQGAGLDQATATWAMTYGYSSSGGQISLSLPDSSGVTLAAAASTAAYSNGKVSIDGFDVAQTYTVQNGGTNAVLFTAQDSSSSSFDWVLGFKGTSSFSDWIADAANAIGTSDRYYSAVAIASLTELEHGPNGLLTGHSMGGGEAALASVATGIPAITFNAAGVIPGNYGISGSTSQITNYSVAGEPLTTAQSVLPIPGALGQQVIMPAATFPSFGNAFNHTMSAVIPSLCSYVGNCGR